MIGNRLSGIVPGTEEEHDAENPSHGLPGSALGAVGVLLAACGGSGSAEYGALGAPLARVATARSRRPRGQAGGTLTCSSQREPDGTRSTRSASTPVRTSPSSARTICASLTAYKSARRQGHVRSWPTWRPTPAPPPTRQDVELHARDGLNWQDGTESPARTSSTASRGPSRRRHQPRARRTRSRSSTSRQPGPTRTADSTYLRPLRTYEQDRPGLFDKAVVCDGKTITFHLNQPAG